MGKTSKKQQNDMKKAEEKKKQKILEDKNFGVKNKNKSAKVQQQIQNSYNPGGLSKEQKKEQELKEKKRLEKLAEREREKELQLLFKSVDVKRDDVVVPQTMEELEQDIDDEIRDEADMTLEEIVEKERAKIIGGTKVTEETFAQWKQFKVQQKQKELEKLKKNSTAKKSGRELFETNAKIFVDDDEAKDGIFDDDLFLDDEDDVQISTTESFEVPEYNPDTWKEPKLPKVTLLEKIQKEGVKQKDLPVFEFTTDGKNTICTITLPHLSKQLTNKKGYKQKKVAEQNAALYALTWMEKTQTPKEKIEEK